MISGYLYDILQPETPRYPSYTVSTPFTSFPMNDTLIFFLLNAPKAEHETEDTAASMVLTALKELPKKCRCGNQLTTPFVLA